MFRGSVKSTGYPLHSPVSPSLPLPCVTVCYHISAGVYITVVGRLHIRRPRVHVRFNTSCGSKLEVFPNRLPPSPSSQLSTVQAPPPARFLRVVKYLAASLSVNPSSVLHDQKGSDKILPGKRK